MTLGDLAGWCSLAAAVTLAASAVAIGLFFGGAGEWWGPVNDVLIAATLVLLVPPIVAAWRLAPDDLGPWFGLLTAVTVLGVLEAAIGQLLLVVGVISLDASYLTGGVGIVPFGAWAVTVAILVLTREVMPVEVGWLLGASLVVALGLAGSAAVGPAPLTAVLAAGLTALLCAWLVTLAGAVRMAA